MKCMCVCAHVDARMFWTLLVCLRVYVSGRSQGRWVGRECEGEIFTCLFYIVILNVPSWAHVLKEKFHFYALYIDE